MNAPKWAAILPSTITALRKAILRQLNLHASVLQVRPSTLIIQFPTVEGASGRSDAFGRSVREEDDEEALKWAAIEKLPTYDCIRKGILAGAADTEEAYGRLGLRAAGDPGDWASKRRGLQVAGVWATGLWAAGPPDGAGSGRRCFGWRGLRVAGGSERRPLGVVMWWVWWKLPKVKAFLAVVAGMAMLIFIRFIVHDQDNLFVAAEAATIMLASWAIRIAEAPKHRLDFWKALSPVMIAHTIGNVAATVSIAKVVISFIHIIKSGEPAFSVLVSRFFLMSTYWR
ncbi:hypothetical protein GUJ93_ZPchr0001g32796 [Zizania palustris]|uniref:Sugar phosphate transporter domain-containing protein n=1 Tax=Zizania palustris TaxID=103762 RepID=A0A8J5RQQ8_ZIZPA|nr:hypothetical protein GUJ93_ZPchr0001g32796 [Zizania palustris]